MFCLVACDSNDYKQAEELYAAGDYVGVLELYINLGEYEDSQDKVAYCEREIGMTENADYAFLADIEKSILGRMEATRTENFERITIVNTELAYVEKYAEKTFYDAVLKEIADTYIEGLRVQKEALGKEYQYEYQIEWQRGNVLRYEALKALYDKYDFLTENPEFVGAYVTQYDEQKYILDAYNAIEADVDKQTSAEDFTWYLDESGYSVYCKLTNNTKYTLGMFIDMSFKDSQGIIFETNTGYVEKVRPGESYVLEVYISDADRVDTFEWSTYYDYVD